MFSFYSYRDPNCQQTLDAFDASLDWLSRPDAFSQRDVDEAKLGVFQAVDKPVVPGSRGLRQYLSGIDDATFQVESSSVTLCTRLIFWQFESKLKDGKTQIFKNSSKIFPKTLAKMIHNSIFRKITVKGRTRKIPKVFIFRNFWSFLVFR